MSAQRMYLASTICDAHHPGATTHAWAADRIMLDRSAIVIDPDQPSFVQYAVEDLAAYLKEVSASRFPSVQLQTARLHL